MSCSRASHRAHCARRVVVTRAADSGHTVNLEPPNEMAMRALLRLSPSPVDATASLMQQAQVGQRVAKRPDGRRSLALVVCLTLFS